jgi:uncharacterized membrane protein YsdA (DUF1294 family)
MTHVIFVLVYNLKFCILNTLNPMILWSSTLMGTFMVGVLFFGHKTQQLVFQYLPSEKNCIIEIIIICMVVVIFHMHTQLCINILV